MTRTTGVLIQNLATIRRVKTLKPVLKNGAETVRRGPQGQARAPTTAKHLSGKNLSSQGRNQGENFNRTRINDSHVGVRHPTEFLIRIRHTSSSSEHEDVICRVHQPPESSSAEFVNRRSRHPPNSSSTWEKISTEHV